MSKHKNVLGMHVGESASAKFWLSILNVIKNRGARDILIVCVDSLTGFPQAKAFLSKTEIQQPIIQQIRNTTKIAYYKDIKPLIVDLKSVYATPTKDITLIELDSFHYKLGENALKY
jgi:transposase-like protein